MNGERIRDSGGWIPACAGMTSGWSAGMTSGWVVGMTSGWVAGMTRGWSAGMTRGWVNVLVVAAIGAGAAAGCYTAKRSTKANVTRARESTDALSKAFDVLTRQNTLENEQIAGQALLHLNNWTQTLEETKDWKRDDLLARAPKRFAELVSQKQLSSLVFDRGDIQYLLETIRIKRVADRLSRSRSETGAGAAEAEQTTLPPRELAMRLFDWVVSNVQIEKLLDYPKSTASGPAAGGGKDQDPNRFLAAPGPGYRRTPGRVLLLGRGDALERGRLFLALCRQAHLDAVQLSCDLDDPDGRLRPWCVGVLVEGELLLFDPAWGVPLPGPGGEGVATLAQVKANPVLLRLLDGGKEDEKYPFDGERIKTVVALVDAAPQAVSLRFQAVAKEAPPEYKAAFTVQPTELAGRLKGISQLSDVRFSATPLEAYLHQQFLRNNRTPPSRFEQSFQYPNFFLARIAQLRGQFTGGEGLQALKLYSDLRLSDETIGLIPTSSEVQASLKLPLPEAPEQRRAFLLSYQEEAVWLRRHTSYWIGLIQCEQGKYDVAVDWLKNRCLESGREEENLWADGARFNLARAYQALGETAEARKYFEASKSPQRPGDLYRARRLAAGK